MHRPYPEKQSNLLIIACFKGTTSKLIRQVFFDFFLAAARFVTGLLISHLPFR